MCVAFGHHGEKKSEKKSEHANVRTMINQRNRTSDASNSLLILRNTFEYASDNILGKKDKNRSAATEFSSSSQTRV